MFTLKHSTLTIGICFAAAVFTIHIEFKRTHRHIAKMGQKSTKEIVVENHWENIPYDRLSTGDIVLFHNSCSIINKFIQLGTRSEWTHVGVIVHQVNLYPHRGPMLLETNRSFDDNLVDISTNTIVKAGSRVVDLRERLMLANDENISFFKLHGPPQNPEIQEVKVQRLMAEYTLLPYEKNLPELILSAIDFGRYTENKSNLSTQFCSELVAHFLQEMQILSRRLPPNEYVPGDFAKPQFKRSLVHRHTYEGPYTWKTTYTK